MEFVSLLDLVLARPFAVHGLIPALILAFMLT